MQKNSGKYLILDSTEGYEKVFFGILSEIKTFNGGKKLFSEKIMQKLELIQTMITIKQTIKISNTNYNY